MDKILTFADRQAFREWLGKYGTESDGMPHKPAFTNLLAMSHSVQRTYTGFYLDAKSDKTRQTRLEKIIDRLNRNLKPM